MSRITADLRGRRAASEEIEVVCLGGQGKRLFEAAKEPLVYWSGVPSLALPSYADIEKAALEILDLMDTRDAAGAVVTHNAPRRRFQYEAHVEAAVPARRHADPADLVSATPPVKPPQDIERLLTHLGTECVLIDLDEAAIQLAISDKLPRVAAMKLRDRQRPEAARGADGGGEPCAPALRDECAA